VSNIGTWMQLVAQSLLVLHLTGSPALTGLTLSLQAAPGLLLGVVGGAAVDALPRRHTVAVCQALLGLVALATAVLAATGQLGVGALMALAVLTGIVATVDGPAVALLGNELVPESDVPSAIALGSVATSAGRVVGTAAAGVVVGALGIPAAYVANGLSFLLVAAVVPFVRSVRPFEPARRTARRAGGLREGFDHLLGSRALLGLLIVGALTSALGRNYSLSFAALVTGPLHAGAAGFGLVSAVLAVGAVLGALAAARHTTAGTDQVARLALVGGLLQVVAAFALDLPMLLFAVLPLALVESVQDTLTGTVLQTRPPAHLRGRVLGAWQSATAAWSLAGPPLLGWLLQACGARAGLALGGAAIVAAVLALRTAHARRPVSRDQVALVA
jgi:MFS family permease